MSWSVGVTGTKEEVAKRFADEMTASEARYEGTEEAADIASAKVRGLALLAAQQLPDDKLSAITAYGSHSTLNGSITHASFKLELSYIDAPKTS